MKSSSYTEGLTMSPEHIDTATNSVRSSLRPGQRGSQTTEEQTQSGHYLCFQVTCRSGTG